MNRETFDNWTTSSDLSVFIDLVNPIEVEELLIGGK